VGTVGAKFAELKADWATLLELESIVHTEILEVGGLVGIERRFCRLLMTTEVVEMGKVRGKVRGDPLYCAEVRLKRDELMLNTTELSAEKGLNLLKLIVRSVRLPTILFEV
jgi:hypothetical protein